MPHLLNSRGVALRFYLLALFEAQCRPKPRQPWKHARPLSGPMGWGDLIAIDAAYSRPVKIYQHKTKQNRDLSTSRDRQVKGALRTLQDLNDQALVVIPAKANGRDRDYGGFLLMDESGRGGVPTPNYYTLPSPGPQDVEILCQFFLNGWIQILYPSEVATWLILRFLRSQFPKRHEESGVYLYGQEREGLFHLRRDSYEDSCRNLVDFGLIRHVPPPASSARSSAPEPIDWPRLYTMATQASVAGDDGHVHYQANRYQFTDEGLNRDALSIGMTTFQTRKQTEG